MIASLRGQVAALTPDSVVVDVAGVGYRVFVPGPLVSGLALGGGVTLHTHLVVRENELALYGAGEPETLALFVQLLTVNGVGPRLAMAMLSAMPASTLAACIAAEDVVALTRVNGVGRKTAQRVVLDLKGKLSDFAADGSPIPAGALSAEDGEALAALAALGYSTAEARRALAAAGVDPDASVESRIFAALRTLGGG